MQATLCASLGVTVILAWWLGRIHAANLEVKLDGPQTWVNSVLKLDVRPPVNWKIEIYPPEDNTAEAKLTEEKARYGSQRLIDIFLEGLSPDEPLPDAEQQLNHVMGNRPTGVVEKIEMMGHSGILKEYPPVVPDPAAGGRGLRAIVCAFVVVPGQRPALVQVRMIGPFTFTSTDIAVLRTVAQSLQASDPLHPAPPLTDTLVKPQQVKPTHRQPGKSQSDDSDD